MTRINDKKGEINNFIKELQEVMPQDYEEYTTSTEKRLASERAFEKIIEATNDLAILIIKNQRIPLPTEDEKAFDILAKANIISKKSALKLKQAKGMRNILAHQYDNLDEEIIFEAIHDKIIHDVQKFIEESTE